MVSKGNALLERIAQLEAGEMDNVIPSIRERYKQLHPDVELILAAVPKDDPKERAAFYKWLVRYVRDYEKDIQL